MFVVYALDLIVIVWFASIVFTLEVHGLFCWFSWTFLVVPLYLYLYICHSFAWAAHDECLCLNFISFCIHHSFSVTSFSLGFRLFYSVAIKLHFTVVVLVVNLIVTITVITYRRVSINLQHFQRTNGSCMGSVCCYPRLVTESKPIE